MVESEQKAKGMMAQGFMMSIRKSARLFCDSSIINNIQDKSMIRDVDKVQGYMKLYER